MASASDIYVKLQKLTNDANKITLDYNTKEANTARTWQKMMSDTSHQREVADLKAAGLNPVLSSGGQGAQSYTTSSASAQADNPANAVASAYGADKSAAATRAAAAASAAATRYAAAQQASAMRYAAAMSYATQKDSWKWKSDYMKAEYKQRKDYMNKEYAQKIQLANATPTKSIGGVLDKLAQRAGLYDLVGTNTVKGIVNKSKLLLNDPKSFFKEVPQGAKITAYNFGLNKAGNYLVGNQLNRLGIKNTERNRKIYVRAIIFGKDYDKFVAICPKKSNSARINSYRGMQLW